jgi:hypothetical protein
MSADAFFKATTLCMYALAGFDLTIQSGDNSTRPRRRGMSAGANITFWGHFGIAFSVYFIDIYDIGSLL